MLIAALSEIVNEADVTSGGLFEATMRTHTLEVVEIPFVALLLKMLSRFRLEC